MTDEHLPDILNQIFDLPVDWEFTRAKNEISLDILEEFSRLCRIISQEAFSHEYHSAISFLWSTRRFVGIDKFNSSEFIGTEISSETSAKIRDCLEINAKAARNFIAPIARNGPSLSAILMHQNRDQIFELLLAEERIILRNWGLNQQSAEIVISRLRAYEFQIFLNCSPGGSVNSNALAKAIQSIFFLSKAPVRAFEQGPAAQRARYSDRRNLVSAKDKVIGLATLFGDAAPIIAGKDFGVASYFSTVAGATTMAILPRGKARPPN